MSHVIQWWRAQTDRQRVFLTTSFLLAAVGLASWFVLYPLANRIQALNLQKKQLSAQVLTLRSHDDAAQEQLRRQLLVERAAWQKKMPEQVQTPDMLRMLETSARQSGVRVVAVKPQASRINGPVTEHPYEVTVTGDFFAAQRFVQQVETKAAPNVRVAGFNLSTDAAGNLKQQYVLAAPTATRLPGPTNALASNGSPAS